MKAEWQGSRLSKPEFEKFINEQIIGYFAAEWAAAPPRVPDNVVIALPANPNQRKSTKGAPMWIWDGTIGGSLQWDPSKPAGSALLPSTCIRFRTVALTTCGVDAAINTYNATAVGGGFQDWRVPSKLDYDGLLAGRFPDPKLPATDARGLLLRMFRNGIHGLYLGDVIDTYPWIWTSEPAGIPSTQSSLAMACNRPFAPILVGNITGYAHTALPVRATLRTYPTGYPLTNVPDVGTFIATTRDTTLSQAQYLEGCRERLARTVTNNFAAPGQGLQDRRGAQLFAIRPSTAEYLPLQP
jgi:hypothetical protein